MVLAGSEVVNACWYQKCLLDSVTVTVLRIMCGPAGEGLAAVEERDRDRLETLVLL